MRGFSHWIPFLKRKEVEESNNSNITNKRMRFDFDNAPQTAIQETNFMDTVRKILSCAVCFEVGAQTKQCKNGHLICFQCITRMQQSTSDFNCPVCRCSLKKGLMRSLIAEQMVLELPALCRFCKASMSAKELRQHEKSICPLRNVPCKYNIFGCNWEGKAENSESHFKTCELREKPVHEVQDRVIIFAKEMKESSQKSLNQWNSLVEKIKETSEGYKFIVKQIMLNRRRAQGKKTNSNLVTFKSPNIYHANSCCRRHGWVLECFFETAPLKIEYKINNESKKKHKVSFFVSSIQYDEQTLLAVDQLHVIQFSRSHRESGRYEIELLEIEPHVNALKVTECISLDLCVFYEVDPEDGTAEAEEDEEEEDTENSGTGAGNFLLALLSPNLQNGAASATEDDAESIATEEGSTGNETQETTDEAPHDNDANNNETEIQP